MKCHGNLRGRRFVVSHPRLSPDFYYIPNTFTIIIYSAGNFIDATTKLRKLRSKIFTFTPFIRRGKNFFLLIISVPFRAARFTSSSGKSMNGGDSLNH